MQLRATRRTDPSCASTLQFHDLLLASLPRLRLQAIALTRHRPDAEDLVQQAVVNALSAKDSFELGTNFGAWIARILRNRFLTNVSRRRETVAIDEVPISLLELPGSQEDNFALNRLGEDLMRLKPEHRAILMMITIEGLSYSEVAEQLGMAVGTVKCLVFRIRKRLKDGIAAEEMHRPTQGQEPVGSGLVAPVRPRRRSSASAPMSCSQARSRYAP
jgi:RNA polymerase sigma-70 factor (ECF subfamily)